MNGSSHILQMSWNKTTKVRIPTSKELIISPGQTHTSKLAVGEVEVSLKSELNTESHASLQNDDGRSSPHTRSSNDIKSFGAPSFT